MMIFEIEVFIEGIINFSENKFDSKNADFQCPQCGGGGVGGCIEAFSFEG